MQVVESLDMPCNDGVDTIVRAAERLAVRGQHENVVRNLLP